MELATTTDRQRKSLSSTYTMTDNSETIELTKSSEFAARAARIMVSL